MSTFETERRSHPRIDVRALEILAIEKYHKCPKYLTIMRHASLEDDSEFHCILLNTPADSTEAAPLEYQRDLVVPEQKVILAKDRESGLFTILRVSDPGRNCDFYLITSVTNRMGFLLPLEKLPRELDPQSELLL